MEDVRNKLARKKQQNGYGVLFDEIHDSQCLLFVVLTLLMPASCDANNDLCS